MRRFRDDHHLGNQPIKDLFELAHITLGVDVLSMDADEAEHGLTMLDPTTGRVAIAVATTAHAMRQRSTIAHEIGHVVAGDLYLDEPLVPGANTPEEILANAFARHLLLPLEAVTERHEHPVTDKRQLSDLVQEFEVSPHIAAIQLRTAKLLSPATCAEWSKVSALTLANDYGWRSQYRSLSVDSSMPKSPQDLMARAVEGYRRGVLGLAELARWYDLDPRELEAELGPPALGEDDPDGDGDGDGDDWDDWDDDDAPLFPNRGQDPTADPAADPARDSRQDPAQGRSAGAGS